MLAGQRGDEIGRNLGGVGEGFVVSVGSSGITPERPYRRHIELGVLRAEMARDLPGEGGLVVAASSKPMVKVLTGRASAPASGPRPWTN